MALYAGEIWPARAATFYNTRDQGSLESVQKIFGVKNKFSLWFPSRTAIGCHVEIKLWNKERGRWGGESRHGFRQRRRGSRKRD